MTTRPEETRLVAPTRRAEPPRRRESDEGGSSNPSTFNHPLSTSFWLPLETIPGGMALPTIWKRHLGSEFEIFASLFLKARTDDPAQSVPCPWNCGCSHKVVPQSNGILHGVCQCKAQACDTYTVLPDEIIPLELDWSKLAHVLCRAFGLQPNSVKLGLYNTLQLGTWPAPVLRPVLHSFSDGGSAFDAGQSTLNSQQPVLHSAPGEAGSTLNSQLSTINSPLPVILTLASSRPEFLNTITLLVARLGQPFILLAATNRHLGPAAKELLANLGAAFFALDQTLTLNRNPNHNLSSSSLVAPEPDVGGPVAPELNEAASRITNHESRFTSYELCCTTPPAELFAQVTPLAPDPSDEDLARRTFLALQHQDDSSRRQPPTLYTVFQLYCVKELTIPQIARKCRCSVGTVANRLNLLRAKTGVAPERLRRVSPYFLKFDEAFRQANRNYRRRSTFSHI